MTRAWLIRHGEPAGEWRRRCYGSLDVGLSPNGAAQVARVAEELRAEPVSAIYTSPRSRALESARILARVQSQPFQVIADLREISFGDFEGLTFDEISTRYPDVYRQWMQTPTEVRFPNGESFAEMRVRVLRAFDAIRRESAGQTVGIVSHGGVNRILIAWALQIPDRNLFRVAQDHAAINLLEIDGDFPSVRLVNRVVGLPAPGYN